MVVYWQASKTGGGKYGYTLVGTTCHPGFKRDGFELPSANEIQKWIADNPGQESLIRSLQRGIL